MFELFDENQNGLIKSNELESAFDSEVTKKKMKIHHGDDFDFCFRGAPKRLNFFKTF